MKGQGEEEEEVKQTQTYDCVSIIGADTDEIGVFLKKVTYISVCIKKV